MKILLIDNGTKHLPELMALCNPWEVEILTATDLGRPYEGDYDTIILSGSADHGAQKGSHDYYQNELALIRSTTKPVLGICLGFELLALAYGVQLHRLPVKIEDDIEIIPSSEGCNIFGNDPFMVHEGHRWVIDTVDGSPLIELARSSQGIEAFRHETLPVYGVQFHPEVEIETVDSKADELHPAWQEVFMRILTLQ